MTDLDSTPLKPRKSTGFFGRILRGKGTKHDPSAQRLLSTKRSSNDILSTPFDAKRESMRLLEPNTESLHRDNSFTISAVHSVHSEKNLQLFGTSKPALTSRTSVQAGKVPFTSSYYLVASSVTRSSKVGPSHDIIAINKELERMFKLQLGPLTIGRDIPPVLCMWKRLTKARMDQGRKAVAETWASLARATAIVARKMTTEQIIEVIDAQCKLVYPCPRSLRLPTEMLLALADRAGHGGALEEASEAEVMNYCIIVGCLMDYATTLTKSNASHSENWLRALSRSAAIMPLVEAGMREATRRAKTAENKQKSAQLVAAMMGELAGKRLGAPARCLNMAAITASDEVENAQAAFMDQPWWKKVAKNGSLRDSQSAVSARMGLLLPSHTDVGAQQAARFAGETAEYLARSLLPGSVGKLTAKQLLRLTAALSNACVDDSGAPSHQPLRQALGLVLAEAVRRAESDGNLSRTCVREVVVAARKRLLHVKFELAEPVCGVPAALSKLEAWKSKIRRLEPAEMQKYEMAPSPAISKEATSLELHESLREKGDNGEEEVVSSIRKQE